MKSKPRTFGDLLCEVNRDPVTSLTWKSRNANAENPRRILGDEKGMMSAGVPTNSCQVYGKLIY